MTTYRSILVYCVALTIVGLVHGHTTGEEEHDHDHDHQSEAVETDAAATDLHAGHTHAHSSSDCWVTELQNYDLSLHIAAVFVMMVASAIGVFLPVILGKLGSRNKLFGSVFFVLKYFGSGIIISLAFVHLLIHAFFNLTRYASEYFRLAKVKPLTTTVPANAWEIWSMSLLPRRSQWQLL